MPVLEAGCRLWTVVEVGAVLNIFYSVLEKKNNLWYSVSNLKI